MTQGSTRRMVLATGAAALVAGCSGTDTDGGSSAATSSAPAAADRQAAPAQTRGVAAGEELGRTVDIPVGGGKVFAAQKVVVTQPKAGEFKAFSAVCTHQGCTVNRVVNGAIECPCHGSAFRAEDGTVSRGPAQQPLEAKRITVSGGTVRLT
ncbi:Rieske (2Fe-2S) protein [Streptomyces thermodiastaticus]|uniref:Rieske (2Fe-2S) protein n=1 Tax=Streptomyces thermodiastaticus TaxID=44061 RepID=UPI00167A1051|nr:Rieske (2Fe-2S) protein [Streptomyces thermodiastaticus]MCE7549322.1 Rieske (2Fe-2S) protein [Streptomyces thermodiastaticus]GHF80832.1 iron-sulfur protein [Streptomyces thermodiastaticus]